MFSFKFVRVCKLKSLRHPASNYSADKYAPRMIDASK